MIKGKTKGFTLVELLIVISIIGVLVAIVVIAVNPVSLLRDSRDTKARTEMNQLKASLQLYFNDWGDYPTADEFDGGSAGNDFIPGYMKQLPAGVQYGEDGSQGDYIVGVNLENPSAEGNDKNTADLCMGTTTTTKYGVSRNSGGGNSDSDFFICPD